MNKRFVLFALFALLSAMLVACGGGAAPTQEPVATEEPTEVMTEAPVAATEVMTEEPTEEALSGDVVIDGSSTVFPITTAVAEEYAATQPDVRVSVGEAGTGGGFKKFCGIEQAPSTDISDASRPIKAEGEADICAQNNVEYLEFLIAYDGLTVVVNKDNDWVQCLTVAQLGQLFGPDDAANADKWSDIDPSWPADEISFFVPDPDSGTRTYFVEEIIQKGLGLEADVADLRQDDHTTFSSDDNVLVEGVAGDTNTIGFFGYAYYIENADRLRAVAIENKDGECVEPSDASVRDGSYNPLSRPLFIYVNKQTLTDKPQVADFVRFFLSENGAPAVMAEIGYSMPPEGTYDDDIAALEDFLGSK